MPVGSLIDISYVAILTASSGPTFMRAPVPTERTGIFLHIDCQYFMTYFMPYYSAF